MCKLALTEQFAPGIFIVWKKRNMKTSPGSWRKPPLAYVVAELAISVYYAMPDALPDLQRKLFASYPKVLEGAENVILESGTLASQPTWQFISESQTHGVYISPRSISLHATSYVNSSDFLTYWAIVLDAIQSIGLPVYVKSAGLRYFDLIVPEENRFPADYISEKIQGLVPEGVVSVWSLWHGAFLFDRAQVSIRVSAPSPADFLFPPELRMLPLKTSQIIRDAEQKRKEGKLTGFIDTECMRMVERTFSASDLLADFTDMHEFTSQSFRAVLSPLAEKEWK